MHPDIKISVLIATLNSQKTINSAIKSILNQTYKNYEIVIVDGLSNDKTLEIIDSIKNSNQLSISVKSEKDYGFYDAINKGLQRCTGDIIGILGSDDQFAKGAFSQIINNYKSDIDIYYGNIFKVREVDNKLYAQKQISKNLEYFSQSFPLPHPSVFVNKRWYENFQFDTKFKICGDYHFMYKSYLNNAKFKYVNFEFVYMMYGGLSSNMSLKLKEDFILRREFNGFLYALSIYIQHFFKLKYYGIRRFIADLFLSKKRVKAIEAKKWQEFQYNQY